MSEQRHYYKVDLEIARHKDKYVFGFINVSHIPYEKLYELFKDQITHERFLFDDSMGYMIDKDVYNKHKEFFDKEIPIKFDFKLFQYSVGFGSVEIEKYQKDYYEELPPFFEGKS